MKPVLLSGRLRAAADMVTVGSRVCDVGCDHGFVPIYLIEQGISPGVLAMDVKRGPLSAAKQHIADRGLNQVIQTRLSDGLHNYSVGESDTLICAGMGGRLMIKILSDDKAKTESFRELILQPQSQIEEFRRWLRMQGYCITDENMIEEEGKFYPMMRVETSASKQDGGACGYKSVCRQLGKRGSNGCEETCGGMKSEEVPGSAAPVLKLNNTRNDFGDKTDIFMLCKLIDRYGPILLRDKNNTLTAYLKREERIYGEILEELQAQGLSDEKRKKRYEEVSQLIKECRVASEIVTS